MSESADTALPGTPATLGVLATEVRALRHEVRSYIERHDREHEQLGELCRNMQDETRHNTDHRLSVEAQLRVLKWLVGSNIGVLVGLIVILLGVVSERA